MELILLDSRLVIKAEHSYTLAKTVPHALAKRKLRYRIFGLSGLDAGRDCCIQLVRRSNPPMTISNAVRHSRTLRTAFGGARERNFRIECGYRLIGRHESA